MRFTCFLAPYVNGVKEFLVDITKICFLLSIQRKFYLLMYYRIFNLKKSYFLSNILCFKPRRLIFQEDMAANA